MELSNDEIQKAARQFIFNKAANLNLRSKNDELVDAFARGAAYAAEKLNLKATEKYKKGYADGWSDACNEYGVGNT